jgi:hypothetical protein
MAYVSKRRLVDARLQLATVAFSALVPLGLAPAGEIAEREHQHAAQYHVIDQHHGVCGFHPICSHGSALAKAP